MALLDEIEVGVLGAGAMGTGIAQVPAAAGHSVTVLDAFAPSIDKAEQTVEKALKRDVEKGRLSADESQAIAKRLRFEVDVSEEYASFKRCGLVIEAIVEDLDVKKNAFRALEKVVRDDCVLATNTSSLSIAAVAAACERPQRVIGMHFFNPATVLPLVEVIGAINSDAGAVNDARVLAERWGKVPVTARDTPGFIVNRVARPFYGESLRIYEEGIADFATIDWAMRELGGFKMGPFELMDLIGNDVNYAVTCSVFEALGYDPRYRPSITQRRMVEAGRFGRKSGMGYYDHREGAEKPAPLADRALGQRVVDRIVTMLINEAADALHFGIATAADIDLAMTKGVNYPKGLLKWGDEIGLPEILRRLGELHDIYGEERYRSSPALKMLTRQRRNFHGAAS